jgi:hypothetical protein
VSGELGVWPGGRQASPSRGTHLSSDGRRRHSWISSASAAYRSLLTTHGFINLSKSPKLKTTTDITPFIVKNAASSRLRSPGLTR